MVGPFIFLDHMGPADFRSGEGIDVRPHPHIGLSMLTYLFDGEIHHRDSLGVSQKIRPGEVNWMTAGSGIVHSERTDPSLRSSGGLMHGMQAWVALPREDEEVTPTFAHHAADVLPELSDGGVWARLIAGSTYGLNNDVRTFSPLFYLHAELAVGASIPMPLDHAERAAYVVSGSVVHEGTRHEARRMLVFANGGKPVFSAEDAPARVMLLGGASLGPRHIWWNLVSSRRERIEQAKADWKSGRMALPPDDDHEFIPLPDEPPPPEEPTHPL
jgi:redox-sensitive bicupin YhaK (pirin superfamily)